MKTIALILFTGIFLLLPISSSSTKTFILERISGDVQMDLRWSMANDKARRSRISGGGVLNYVLNGSADIFAYGMYFTRIELGTPGKEFAVQIDTGSDLTWVSCDECSTCPENTNVDISLTYFSITNSSTASKLDCFDVWCPLECKTGDCMFLEHYTDKSEAKGNYVADRLRSPGNSGDSAEVIFGCATSRSGYLASNNKAIDGILGLGPGKVSIVRQLYSQGQTPLVFSHCLQGKGGGQLSFGAMQEPSVRFTPLVKGGDYRVTLESITVNGVVLPINPEVFETSHHNFLGGTVLDSGSTLAYLVADAYDPLVAAIDAKAASSGALLTSGNNFAYGKAPCYLIPSDRGIDIFPQAHFNFAGGRLSLHLQPEDYLWQVGSKWCITSLIRDDDMTVLGDYLLKDRIVVYDLAEQRVGISEKCNCSMPINVVVTSNGERWSASAFFGLLLVFINLYLSFFN